MSVEDSANQLIAGAESFMDTAIGISTSAATSLSEASDTIHRVRDLAANSMAQANNLLGSGHAGIGGIGASANAVSQKADEVIAAIQTAVSMILDLDHAITTHSSTMRQVGHALLGGS